MDDYTSTTKAGLDKRFRLSESDGIYYAFQPIYGHDKGHSEPGLLARYTRTYAIMTALSHLRFETLLDVGGAEGYTSHVARSLFSVDVEHSELSEQACQRARDIFNLRSTAVDVQALPFDDNHFDAVLCSETLEHVPGRDAAVQELLRIAAKALVITVPHESPDVIDTIREEGKFHGHIHTFDADSFGGLKSRNCEVMHKKIVSVLSRVVTAWTEPYEREWRAGMRWPKAFIDAYNACIPVLKAMKRVFGRKGISLVMRLDAVSCRIFRSHGAILFIILKDKSAYTERATRRVSPGEILDITVPFFYMDKPR